MSTRSETRHRTRCPVCGLELEVSTGGAAPMLEYDFGTWGRLCPSTALGGPSMCLAGMRGAATAVDPPIDAPHDRLRAELLLAKARL
jgi:hypothetical protein